MKKFINGCGGLIAVLGIVLFIAYECTREKQPPPPKIAPEYTGPREKHEQLDPRAFPFFTGRYGGIVRYGDTTITWNKRKGKWRKIYYTERKRVGNSAYSNYKVYYENMNLYQECEQFQNGMTYGLLREYDDEGTLIRTYDYDDEFEFTINDLIKKIKEEYNLDLTKQLTNGQWADRYIVNSGPVSKYRLRIKTGNKKHFLEISGHDGRKMIGSHEIYE